MGRKNEKLFYLYVWSAAKFRVPKIQLYTLACIKHNKQYYFNVPVR